MDTEKCKALLCTIETGSLSAAAEALGYTPSGISRMMASLESETGFPLLVRGRNGVVPTKECKTLLPTIRSLAKWGDQYIQQAQEIRGLNAGVVTIGIASVGFYRWFSKLVSSFCKEYPNIEVRILDGFSTELVDALEEQRVDLCLISKREGNFNWIHLADEELVAWVPANSRFARNETFPISSFAEEPYIEVKNISETDCTLALNNHNVNPDIKFSTTDSYEAYLMVEAGLGLSLNQSLTSKDWTGNVKILPLDIHETIDIGMAVPEILSPAAQKFAEFTAEKAKEHPII